VGNQAGRFSGDRLLPVITDYDMWKNHPRRSLALPQSLPKRKSQHTLCLDQALIRAAMVARRETTTQSRGSCSDAVAL